MQKRPRNWFGRGGRDGVAYDDPVGADQDFFHEKANDALAFGNRAGLRTARKPAQEVLEVLGQVEIRLTVELLGIQGG